MLFTNISVLFAKSFRATKILIRSSKLKRVNYEYDINIEIVKIVLIYSRAGSIQYFLNDIKITD